MRFFILLVSMTIATTSLSAQDSSRITVNGEGVVQVTPDRAKIKVRVEKKGDSAKAVKSQVDESVSRVLKFLESKGIAQEDYQTDYLNLNKQTDYNTKETHYSAQQAISITLQDLSGYSSLMNGLMDSGINRIDGVSFEDSKLEEHQQEARQKAAKNALEKAKTYAEALDVEVGKPMLIQERGGAGMPRPILMKAMSASSVGNDAAGDSPLAVGQIEVKESVEVSFYLK